MTNINEDKAREEAENQAKARINFLSIINDSYGGDIGFVLSSELSKREKYQENLGLLREKAEEDPEFRRSVLEAIPKDRRDNPKSINYPLEELAVIESLNVDIKVGPRYEAKYDVPARKFAPMIGFKKFSAVHLRNGYPFGNPEIPVDKAEEIEEFGVLPYKKNSKGLRDFRIDPTTDSIIKVLKLISETEDDRAIRGLLEIYKLASLRDGSLFSYDPLSSNLKDLSMKHYGRFIGTF